MINVHEEFANNRELYKIMYSEIIPILSKRLSAISQDEMNVIEDELDY